MTSFSQFGTVALVSLCAWQLAGCATTSGKEMSAMQQQSAGGSFGFGGSQAGQSSGAPGAAGFAVSNNENTPMTILKIKDAGARTHDSSCGAIAESPEQITVYKEASVTDTTYTYTPVALFIMVDRSGSMITGFPPPADAHSWQNSTDAITAFVKD